MSSMRLPEIELKPANILSRFFIRVVPTSPAGKCLRRWRQSGLLLFLGALLGGTIFTGSFSSLALATDAITVELNGQPMLLEYSPLLKDGTTLIPLRLLIESLGAEVKWEESKRTITASRWQRTVRLELEQEQAYVLDKDQPEDAFPDGEAAGTVVRLRPFIMRGRTGDSAPCLNRRLRTASYMSSLMRSETHWTCMR